MRELLRKEDKSDAELREYCRDSLTDFLSGETDAFVESLFDAIASGEYERAVGTPTQRPAGRGSSCESWRLSEGDAWLLFFQAAGRAQEAQPQAPQGLCRTALSRLRTEYGHLRN